LGSGKNPKKKRKSCLNETVPRASAKKGQIRDTRKREEGNLMGNYFNKDAIEKKKPTKVL